MLRSSYITDFYEKNKTLRARKGLADKMRHSVMTAARNYMQVTDTPMDLRLQELEKENARLRIENTKLKNERDKYRETEDQKDKHRKRVNVLHTANVKKIGPKESTIKNIV